MYNAEQWVSHFTKNNDPQGYIANRCFVTFYFELFYTTFFKRYHFYLLIKWNFLPNLAYFENGLAHKINRFCGNPLGGLQEI